MTSMTHSAPGGRAADRTRAPGSDSGAAVELAGLTFRYDDFTAVDRLDLDVRIGEVFALLGTNGAGKTTTLELIEGFRRPAEGTIRVLGLDPCRDRRALAARTGILLQEAGLINELTTVETLRMWAGLSSRDDDVDAVLALVELDARRDVAVERLSGGERRRLDFALAVWGRPSLIILDEPSTGLDPESRQRLWATVRDLRDAGCTVLLTTHYLAEAESLADRVAIMHQGRVHLQGSVPELLARHPSRIAATMPSVWTAALPAFKGRVQLVAEDEQTRLWVETSTLQADLTALLAWAADHDVALSGLTAVNASLEEIFLQISTQ
ncbi:MULTISPECIES: ABC transporter ATP-binding protein [Actinoalloteichus]|uniref:ABC-type multidrug transport system, ATPase component n=1 Tax=Actinoalloteichus fjordicus TaxID=1612552 RepID=A0AAC9L849_9PSEU|nr:MULTISPECIES: ABC transporter ATP-binding protein [Actinoalloteichus]APU12661.1 ABC-type multidrug transport system, ATPase component [Actinoalloteichus fjordicus]APU18631.1 ABC-type multidrug transport system, ATPase component [Actinoalloteichus sp. GBA129-24]